jgi:hypothetical protein
MAKKRNPQDTTLRNSRSSSKKIAKLSERLDRVEKMLGLKK